MVLNTRQNQAVPNQPKTPMRGVRIPPADWDAILIEAAERDLNASDVIREAIVEHIERRAEK